MPRADKASCPWQGGCSGARDAPLPDFEPVQISRLRGRGGGFRGHRRRARAEARTTAAITARRAANAGRTAAAAERTAGIGAPRVTALACAYASPGQYSSCCQPVASSTYNLKEATDWAD